MSEQYSKILAVASFIIVNNTPVKKPKPTHKNYLVNIPHINSRIKKLAAETTSRVWRHDT